MAMKLRVTAQAKREAARILGYIAKDNPSAAVKPADALEQGMLRLMDYPVSAPVLPNRVNPSIRQLIVPPCRILYRIMGQDVMVVGILRCEQDLEETRLEGL